MSIEHFYIIFINILNLLYLLINFFKEILIIILIINQLIYI